MKTCEACRYCIQTDYGYSNYTVEGTHCDCLLGLNPSFPVDRFWGEEPTLKFAQQCHAYQQGSGLCFNVEDDYDNIDQINYVADQGLTSEFENWRGTK